MINWNRWDWIILLALTLLAAALRFYGLGTIPPGFQFDEAFNAIDAQQVLAGNRPLFLPANAGREVLYTYWQAFLVSLFGMSVYTLRLASAIFGIAAVPLTYILLRVMLRRNSRVIAVLTSIALATSLWHIHFSHYGIRVIMMPVVFSLAFGAYWLAGHTQKQWIQIAAYVVSGLFIGLSVWTHPAGRFAPFVLLLYTLWLVWQVPEARKLSLSGPITGLFISGVVAFLVFIPLGLEFIRYPEFFFGHASEVSVFAERVSGNSPLVGLAANTLRVLGMFAISGDVGWTHNVAGRPVFDLLMAAVFIGGSIIWALRIVRSANAKSTDDPDTNALVLLAVWAAVMLLPSVFSEAAPNYSRTLPALPALFLGAGLGLAWVAAIDRPFQYTGVVIAAVVIAYSGARSTYDYFVYFPSQEEVYYLYDADKLDALELLAELTEENNVYLSQIWGDYHATVSMLRRELGIKSLDTSYTLVLPPQGKGAVYAFPSEQIERAEQIAELWPSVDVRSVPDKFGNILLHLVEVPPELASRVPSRFEPIHPFPAAFDNGPNLLAQYAEIPDKQVTLLWEADEAMDASLTSYMHLIDPDGRRVAQIDRLPGNGSYRTNDWDVGELILDRYYPAINDLCAAGVPLRVQVGWYSREEGHATRTRADATGDTALAGIVTLPILSHDPGVLHPQNEVNEAVTENLTFRGSNLISIALESQPGSPITVDLYWRSDHEKGSSPDYSNAPITLSLTNGESEYPIWTGELAPDSDWDPGEEICRRIRTRIPTDLPPGPYTLRADFGEIAGDSTVATDLLTLDVAPPSRLFTIPPLEVSTHATLTEAYNGDQIQLLGVVTSTIETEAPRALDITLAWQADTSPQGNYKVFVHLIDSAGNIISQSDATPGSDYPTNRWLEGEVVLDRHRLALPDNIQPGEYRMLAGMYDPVSALRLEIRDEYGLRITNDGVVLLETTLTE